MQLFFQFRHRISDTYRLESNNLKVKLNGLNFSTNFPLWGTDNRPVSIMTEKSPD